jgi:hypothetical protein
MQTKTWTTNFLFKEFLSFFKKLIPCGISLNNRHLLVLNGHGSHATLKVIEQAQKFGLDMILFTYLPCTSTIKCGLFQAFQNNP